MSEHQFAGVGAPAPQGLYTWGGSGARRVCDTDGRPFPAGNYEATVAAGLYMVTDAKFGTQQWVYAGEMIPWNGTPDPVRVALQQVVASAREAGKLLGVGV